ncbi:uncharacterized protein LOC126266575 [Aethina tumida]|uniref:uncharacterized protein LOC126266575 n=1 Tax=Aethina tumida TaxID=116153 RepID=UPI0021493BDE|nr:uncharacterized protein LOC126266575 [Aethina tumida]
MQLPTVLYLLLTTTILQEKSDALHCYSCVSINGRCDISWMKVEDCNETDIYYKEGKMKLPTFAMYSAFNISLDDNNYIAPDTVCGRIKIHYRYDHHIEVITYGCMRNKTVRRLTNRLHHDRYKHLFYISISACDEDLCNSTDNVSYYCGLVFGFVVLMLILS